MKRRAINKIYYFITSIGTIDYTIDKRDTDSTLRFRVGNYFTPAEARRAQASYLEFMKGLKENKESNHEQRNKIVESR